MNKINFLNGLLIAFSSLTVAQTAYVDATSYDQSKRTQAHDQSFYAEHSMAYSYTDEKGATMPYRLFLPPNYNSEKEYPLLLSFHGAGARGDDNLKQLRPWIAGWMDEKIQNEHPCIILMPQCPTKQQWVNVPWKDGSYSFKETPISQAMTMAKAIFDKVLQNYAVDQNRIYVMGASMGGYATWNFVMRYPGLVAAAVPICGAGDPSMAKKLKRIPIWAFHGDQDPVVPLSGSTDMMDALKKTKKSPARLTIYKGVKHDSYTLAWNEPELIDWIFNQKK